MDIQGCSITKRRYVRHAECATHKEATQLPAEIEGVRTHALTSLLRMSAGVLSREQLLLVVDDVSKLEKLLNLGS